MNKLHQIMDTQMQYVRQEVFDEGQGVKLENDRSNFTFSECHIKEEPEDKQVLLSVYSELQDTSNAELNIHVDTKIQTRTEGVQIQKVKLENNDSSLEKIDGTHCSDIYEVDSLNKNLDTGLRTVEQEEEEDKHSLENVSSNSQGFDQIYIFENKESNCKDKNDILVETMTIKQEVQDHFQYRMYSPSEDTNVTTENNNSHVENSDLTLENSFVNIQSCDLKSENEPRVLNEGDLSREKRGSLIDRYNANISISCTNNEESISNITSTEVKIENNGFNADKCYVKGNDSNFENCGFGIEHMVFPIFTAGPSIAEPSNTLRSKYDAIWQPVVLLTRLSDTIFEDGSLIYTTIAKLADQVNTEVRKTKFKKRNLVSKNFYPDIPKTDKLFSRGKCDGKFTDSNTLKTNQPTDSSEQQQTCNRSNKGLNSVESMRQHMGSHNIDSPHPGHSTEHPFVCNVCGKRFKMMSILRRHMACHSTERPHECNVCGKQFKRTTHLRAHMACHNPERPHECIVCGKRFKMMATLRRHMAFHSTQRPHECIACGKRFKDPTNLTSHMACHSTERPHLCNVCGKRFKRAKDLRRHMTFHSTERPHECIVCGKRFKTMPILRRHMACHSTERPHECNLCGKRCKLLTNLRSHMTCHSTERPHQCNLCGKRFKTVTGFSLHKKKHKVG